jgi:hypothetical protein
LCFQEIKCAEQRVGNSHGCIINHAATEPVASEQRARGE